MFTHKLESTSGL